MHVELYREIADVLNELSKEYGFPADYLLKLILGTMEFTPEEVDLR